MLFIVEMGLMLAAIRKGPQPDNGPDMPVLGARRVQGTMAPAE